MFGIFICCWNNFYKNKDWDIANGEKCWECKTQVWFIFVVQSIILSLGLNKYFGECCAKTEAFYGGTAIFGETPADLSSPSSGQVWSKLENLKNWKTRSNINRS